MAQNKDEYDWIDDAFDDKKNAELEERGMGGGSKAALGIGCVVAVVLAAIALFAGVGFLSSLSELI